MLNHYLCVHGIQINKYVVFNIIIMFLIIYSQAWRILSGYMPTKKERREATLKMKVREVNHFTILSCLSAFYILTLLL